MSDVVYGVALALTDCLEAGDTQGLELIHETLGFQEVAISTLQFALVTLKTLPSGKWRVGQVFPDACDEAEAEFGNQLSELPYTFSHLFPELGDDENFQRIIMDMVASSVDPLLEGGNPVIDIDEAGLTPSQGVQVFSVIALACARSVDSYSSMFNDLVEHGGGIGFLRKLLPQLTED